MEPMSPVKTKSPVPVKKPSAINKIKKNTGNIKSYFTKLENDKSHQSKNTKGRNQSTKHCDVKREIVNITESKDSKGKNKSTKHCDVKSKNVNITESKDTKGTNQSTKHCDIKSENVKINEKNSQSHKKLKTDIECESKDSKEKAKNTTNVNNTKVKNPVIKIE